MPDTAPRVSAPQLDLAVVLLYREYEYAAMYWTTLSPPPVPDTASPVQPYDLTPAGAACRSWSLDHAPVRDPNRDPSTPYDLFGLKPDVLRRLSSTPRRVEAHRFAAAACSGRWDR